ncbi:hypothetical protein BCL67_10951 [Nesterenkonia sandarakina]|uniref:Concanavalin A-like lectin/glucanase superfamily protein n=1 Tax=Nesterenkonia sandarakina TaxID=272918 RepID=A0A2T0YIW6_9MICC|nr:hypothetical protein BCL67_10951 [Nesterenkonia sandarakina]
MWRRWRKMRSATLDGRLEAVAGTPLGILYGGNQMTGVLGPGGDFPVTCYAAFTFFPTADLSLFPTRQIASWGAAGSTANSSGQGLVLRTSGTSGAQNVIEGRHQEQGGAIAFMDGGVAVPLGQTWAACFAYDGDNFYTHVLGGITSVRATTGTGLVNWGLRTAPDGHFGGNTHSAVAYSGLHDENTRLSVMHWLARRFSLSLSLSLRPRFCCSAWELAA